MSARLAHGTSAWFEMAGTLICQAAERAQLPAHLNLSLVERYTDGVELADGVVQGLRLDIVGGKPSFRLGALPDEGADIKVEVTAAASHELNSLYSSDPRYLATTKRLLESGALRVDGDMQRLGEWFGTVHDPIVDRTA